MKMTLTLTEYAPRGGRFPPDAFAHNVGKVIPVNVGAYTVDGTVVAADVDPEGRSVRITVEIGQEST